MILIDTQKEEFSKLKDIRIFGKIDNENRFNRDLLFVALGGIGTEILCKVKGMLLGNTTPDDNINFLVIDSDIPAMEETIEESKKGVGFNALEIISIYRPNLENLLENGIERNTVHPNLAKWMRKDFPNISIGTDGARSNRQVGRLMFANAYEDIRILLFEKLEALYSKSNKLDVIIVSSTCGGTGSGIIADLAYNIKACGKVNKWSNLRVAGCLVMPDVLFANKALYDDSDKKDMLLANGCATMKEINHFMKLSETGEPYIFECMERRIGIKESIFDSCILVSGKKDKQGYIPSQTVYSDIAYFLFKLSCNEYLGGKDSEGNRQLLRDVLFAPVGKGYYKVVNESDYKIPIKEIENICEHQIFSEASKKLLDSDNIGQYIQEVSSAWGELKTFIQGKPGDDIILDAKGIIKIGQFEKPVYKAIKKGQDNLRSSMGKQLADLKEEAPVLVKSLKNRLWSAIEEKLQSAMRELGPFAVIEIIGAAGVGKGEKDRGLIAEIKSLSEIHKQYQPSSEFSRIIESILDIVAHRFFTFPSAKRETENGYFDACIKETLASERTIIMDAIDAQDVFGDTVRWLRQRAERLDEIYTPFYDDLKVAVEGLANSARMTASYLLKDAKRQEFLPSDYVTDSRIYELRRGIINFMVNHEADIDNARVVPVKQEIEKLYREFFMSIGVYAPEKLLAVAFADKTPTLQEENVMFVSATNERRDEIMDRAAKSFVEGSKEKTTKKNLCVLNDSYKDRVVYKKFISLPEIMPHFSNAVKTIFTDKPYNEREDSITLNQGEMVISMDELYVGVSSSMLECADDMQEAYDKVDKEAYFGLHIDEVNRDNRIFPDIA